MRSNRIPDDVVVIWSRRIRKFGNEGYHGDRRYFDIFGAQLGEFTESDKRSSELYLLIHERAECEPPENWEEL